MSKVCVIPNCRIKNDDPGCDKHFFRVPSNGEMKNKWCDAINSYFGQEIQLKKNSYVCERHFEPRCFTPFYSEGLNCLKLTKGSFPSVFENWDIRNQEMPYKWHVPITANSESENEMGQKEDMDTFERCRSCLFQFEHGSVAYKLFEPWPEPWPRSLNTIAEDLSRVANIELVKSEKHSNLICHACCVKLKEVCLFIAMVRKNAQEFQLQYPKEKKDFWPKPIPIEKCFFSDVEIKKEVFSDENDDCDNNSMESEHVETVSANPFQITVNGTISLDQYKTETPNSCDDFEIFEREEYLDTVVKEEPTSEDEASLKALSLECMLCGRKFKCLSGLKAHVIGQHSYNGVKRKLNNCKSPEKNQKKYVCVTCRRSFSTSTDLMVHATCHNRAECYGCGALCDSFAQLAEHRAACAACADRAASAPDTVNKIKTLQDVIRTPKIETSTDKESLTCSTCSEQFSDPYYMKIHQEVHRSPSSPTDTQTDEQAKQTNTDSKKVIKSVLENGMEVDNLEKNNTDKNLCT